MPFFKGSDILNKFIDLANKSVENKDYTEAIKYLNLAINNKEYEAYSILAMFYITGLSVDKDVNKGLEYLYLGEKYNDPKSISMLVDFYYNGIYVEKDLVKARIYYEKACDLNEGHAIGMVGLFYYNEENYSEAIIFFKSGVTFHDQNSMFYLGICAFKGLGMDKDYKLSFMLFNKLYEYGNKNSDLIKYLADSYFNGYGINQDILKAKELYETLNDDESIFNLGLIYKNHLKDYEKALVTFKRVKSVESQFEQALMLYNGLGCIENKNDAYFKFYACAASKYVYAYPFVGDAYYYGYGVKKDYNEALSWYRLALDNNIPNQYINIASVYMKFKNYKEAINYLDNETDSANKYKLIAEAYMKLKKYEDAYNSYLKAKELGDIYSIYELYRLTKKGKGITKNKELANKYYLEYLMYYNKE